MSDAPEKKIQEEPAESSTLFADPSAKYANEKPAKRRNLTGIMIAAGSAVLCVALVVAALIYFVPVDEDAASSSGNPLSITVTDYNSDDVKRMTISGDTFGTVEMYSAQEETSSESAILWYLEGVDRSLTTSSTISTAVGSAVSLSAVRKMDEADADYGFNTPYATVKVESRNDKFEDYTLTVGSPSPDKSGYYVKTTLSDTVYLVSADVIGGFCQDIYNYSTTTVLAPLSKTNELSKYFTDTTLTGFDSITVTGTDYGSKKLTFVPNGNTDTAGFVKYMMTTPYNRFADNDSVDAVFKTVVEGISCAKCYSYNATAEELKKYNLKTPEMVINIRLGSVSYTISASKSDSESYALMINGSNAIYQVYSSVFTCGGKAIEDYFSTCVFSEMLNHFKKITVATDSKSYEFGISYTEKEDEEDVYSVTAGGKEIKAEYFQNYYQQLLGMTVTEFSTEMPSSATSMTVTAERTDGTKTAVQFRKVSDRRYHVSVDGQPMGHVSATTYDNLVKYAQKAYNNEKVPSLID